MRLLDAVRTANQPGPPEQSARLRIACTMAVLVSIAAGAAEGEVAHKVALGGGALVVIGMVFSYRTRIRPPAWIKLIAAASAVSVLIWFFHQLTSHSIADITTVEDPLTVLFISIQVVHSFHVPARRDLVFSVAASAALIAVAAAQAIDLSFAVYAALWLTFCIWALIEIWRSASGGARVSAKAVGSSLAGVCTAAAILFLLLPAPVVSVRISFQSRDSRNGPVAVPGALAGDSGSPVQLSKPGSPAGRARVGGYLGFANSLDTALRGGLGNTVVMRVRAQRPTFWTAETFDTWDGQSWLSRKTRATQVLQQNSPFDVPNSQGELGLGQPDLQTFYMAASSPDLIFHADTARQVWFPSTTIFYGDDGTLVSPIGLGRGAIYTVESSVLSPTPSQLRQASGTVGIPSATRIEYTQLPHPYSQAASLARAVTAGIPDNYDKTEALITWMGANTRYSTNIPPLPPGADTVNEFLFGNRTGFCEQISTSLAVMLRSLGIPAREVVGYVPGGYNPLTDLYEVQEKDAHAWVQVWFPGYGWQSFDPTAVVPLANPSPGATALHDLGGALGRIPVVPVGVVVGGLAVITGFLRWRRSRPATWAEAVARQMDGAGRRARRPRRRAETIVEYASVLEELGSGAWSPVAKRVAGAVYGRVEISPEEQQETLRTARRLRASSRQRRRPHGSTGVERPIDSERDLVSLGAGTAMPTQVDENEAKV